MSRNQRGKRGCAHRRGEMAEWLKAHAWKACVPQGTVGSNPTLSAIERSPMDQTHLIVLLFRLVVLLALLLWFESRFRGGRPPNPMHPSPADDATLLRKRRSRKHDLEVPRIF